MESTKVSLWKQCRRIGTERSLDESSACLSLASNVSAQSTLACRTDMTLSTELFPTLLLVTMTTSQITDVSLNPRTFETNT